MTIDQVLSFFTHHNTAIIEGLVGIIILFGLFLGYRGFFGSKDEGHGAGGMDTAQLEKTLQKILDGQNTGHAPAPRHAKEEESMDLDLHEEETPKAAPKAAPAAAPAPAPEAGDVVRESPAEIQQLRLTLSESQKKIEVLQAQLATAETKAAEAQASASAAPAPAAGGADPAMEAKLRDLEARLAEYEIISEDIADLSRYREENDKLKAELEALKAQGGSSAPPAAPVSQEPVAAAAPAPEPVPEIPAEPETPPAPTPVEEEVAAPDLSALDVDAAALIAEAEATPTEAPASAELIDEELMREFAAAVEGQKALDKVGEKAGDGSTQAEKKSDENAELMNEFENFVTKKS